MRYLVLLFIFAAACKVEDGPPGAPPAPALKTTIVDRAGRAAVNTALDKVLSNMAEKGSARDTWNKADQPEWENFEAIIAADLAIYDALDTVCGNQLLAGPNTVAGRYNALARLLWDDRLFLNTSVGTCNQYLAVELGMAGDCGGRTLFHDVIDTTYSALAIGAVSGVDDGVDADEEEHSGERFPFLAPP